MRQILAGLGIALVHFLVSTNALVLAMGDTIGPRPHWLQVIGRVAGATGLVLGFPAIAFPVRWVPDWVPAGFFGVMFANSLLWGAGLVLLWSWWRHRRVSRVNATE